jgi:hypothetical protein
VNPLIEKATGASIEIKIKSTENIKSILLDLT